MRLIDADTLKDTLLKHRYTTEHNQIFRYIDEQPTVNEKSGWIPCSDRLPDNDNYILISFENFSLPMVGRYEEDKTGGAFYIGDEDKTCISQDLFVNAWQPLPEPYKERDEK